jgi:nitrogenase molybdenum-iron protein alpha chain
MMNFLDAKSAPSREDRLRASVAFGGTCAQVRTCSLARANGCTNLSSAEIMQDLGRELAGFKAHHYDQFVEPIFDALHDVDDVLFSVATNQPFETSNIINRLKPDLVVAHVGGNNIASRHGLPILQLFHPANNYCGYSGVFEVARRLYLKLRNSQFNRQMSLNVPLPFKKDWYEKDPFTYIKYAEEAPGPGA